MTNRDKRGARRVDPDTGLRLLAAKQPQDILVAAAGAHDNRKQPLTLIEALMETKPFHEPMVSREEVQELRSIVALEFSLLDEDEQWLIEALLFGKLSLRFVGRVTGTPKTTVARRRDAILAKLGDGLLAHPEIVEYLNPGARLPQ
jgi:hypothetical protein